MEITTLPPLTYEEAKAFIRDLEKQTNATLRALKAKEHVSYHIHENETLGRFTYNEVVNKHIKGRVVVGRGSKGETRIVSQYHVTRQKLHADLNIGPRVVVKKTEKKWSTR